MTGFVPFNRGFAPNVDPTTPGALLDCSNLIPTLRGMKSAPSAQPFGNPAFPSQARGGVICELLSGAYRSFVGTSTDLYEIIGNANTNVSATPGGYLGGANPWRFAQFGNASIATNGQDPLQQSISAGAFSPITGSPSARIIEVTQGFVFAFNTIDATYGSNPHGWFCSALYDQTNWTPSQATQCARGVIVDTAGEITAGKVFGTNIIVFKQQSMYYGTYQGPPIIWAFNQITPQIGTPCQEAVVSALNMLLFLGTDAQVYRFDGTVPKPIGDDVHEWLSDNWSRQYQGNVASYYDQINSMAYWYFCSAANTTGIPDMSLVYHYPTGKFGRADRIVECAFQTVSGQITWAGVGSLPGVSTWSTLPQIQYNSPYWLSSSRQPAIVDGSHLTNNLDGLPATSALTSSWFGDDYSLMSVHGVLPRFKLQPSSCSGQANTVRTLGSNAMRNWPLGPYYDGELSGDFSDRWAQIVLSFTGNHEILGAFPRTDFAGEI